MRDKFPGLIPKSEEEKDNVWKRCFFVFDSNVFLNLYRYSEKSRGELFSLIDSMGDRLWVPYRVADEFLRNRLQVIYEQVEKYEDASSSIEQVLEKLRKESDHPFVDTEELRSFSDASEKLVNSLNRQSQYFKERYRKDDVLQHLIDIVSGSVGDPKCDDDLRDLVSKGNERLERKIPPGYKDCNKSDSSGWYRDINRLGDYLIWEEVIEEASRRCAPLVFVTDDFKEDWWLIFKGEKISSRPELEAEFQERVGEEFHMYSSERFVSHARNYFDIHDADELVEESRNLAENKKYLSEKNKEKGSLVEEYRNRIFEDRYYNSILHNQDAMIKSSLDAERVFRYRKVLESIKSQFYSSGNVMELSDYKLVKDSLDEADAYLSYAEWSENPTSDILDKIAYLIEKANSKILPF